MLRPCQSVYGNLPQPLACTSGYACRASHLVAGVPHARGLLGALSAAQLMACAVLLLGMSDLLRKVLRKSDVRVQANVSRKKAVKALKSADGDIVSAIMELTM